MSNNKTFFYNRYSLIIIVTLLTMLSSYLLKTYLATKQLTYNFYAEQLAHEQIEKLIEAQQKWEWVSYAVIPLVVIIRSSLVAMCLWVGLFFYDDDNEYKFSKLLNIALWGEFVLLLVGYVKFIYFGLFKTDYTLKDIQQFYPLSITNLLDIEAIEPWLLYPLQTINLFELGYFLVLVYGLHKLLKNNYHKSFEITMVSYGSGLLIWLGLIAFLTLNIS